jgi:hypothetical protein
MTVSELISMLSAYPADTRVTLLDPDRRWLLPIEITELSADGMGREVDFIAITSDSASDEIEGLAARRGKPEEIVAELDNLAQPSNTRSTT